MYVISVPSVCSNTIAEEFDCWSIVMSEKLKLKLVIGVY